MSNVLLLYSSLSGNTLKIADIIKKNLTHMEIAVDMFKVQHFHLANLENYNTIILGAYTWGIGTLPKECNALYNKLDSTNLTGFSFALFGSGDTSHKYFCRAVDHLEHVIHKGNGTLITDSLKINLQPKSMEDYMRCQHFSKQIIQYISRKQTLDFCQNIDKGTESFC